PTLTNIDLEGSNSILPSFGHYRPSDISIDNQGAIWTHASGHTFKLTDTDTAKEYRTEGESYTISGLVYNDVNENDSFDAGEGYNGQLVALNINNEVYETFTRNDGTYQFFLYEENANYSITLPTLGNYVTATNREIQVSVGTTDQNYPNNDFELEPRFINSLVVKSSSKLGAFGFVRDGFENTFTTAIGNVSATQTYSNLELTYVFKNRDEESTNVLPDIQTINVYKLDPNGANPLIENVTISPRSNQWAIDTNPVNYTQTELSISPDITQTNQSIEISFTLPDINPYDVFIIEIETELFDPVENGTIIDYGVSSISSSNFTDGDDNPINSPIVFIPVADRDPNQSGFPPDFPEPYVDPDSPYVEPPFRPRKQVYAPGPVSTPILSSYDPNDKLVDGGVADIINDTDINRKWLTYTIRFENTGNFSAKDIVITDVLDENLDPNSIIVLEASHAYEVDIVRDGNADYIVKFSFNNIFLPFDDENNDGFIRFLIKADEAIVEETIVNNQARIYFDQNPPIITNIIQNRFIEIEPLSIAENTLKTGIKIYPNPAFEEIHVENVTNLVSLELYTLEGKLIKSVKAKNTLNVANLNVGIYILNIDLGSTSQRRKIIIKN
ncbi:MAG: T9SS type A sorting domain-containing protein, partial [Psychroserpens sp.]|nr:T9SS type A sorting domain-containing protein [Psychroserpens sp.]